MKHVERDSKTGRLIFRRVYPVALRPFVPPPSTQLKVSLGGQRLDQPGVMAKYQEAMVAFDAAVVLASKAAGGIFDALTPELAAFLLAAYRADALALDDEVRWQERPLAAKTRAASRMREIINEDIAECRAVRALGDIERLVAMWSDSAVDYADMHGLRLNPDGAEFKQFCRAFNDTQIEVWEAMERRLDGQAVPTPPEPLALREPTPTQRPVAETFDAIAESLLTNVRANVSATTRQGARTALRSLREALGPVTPEGLTRRAVTDWLDLIAQKPAKVPRQHRETPLRELVALYADRPDVPRLTLKTVDMHLSAIASLWRQGRSAGSIDERLPDPFTNRKAPAAPRRKTPKGFSIAELQAIFALPIFTAGVRPVRGRGEASYWLPLMMLWTGARPEEIAQLVVGDISQAGDDRWFLTITDTGTHPVKGQQSLKTSKKDSGVRTFPLPTPLIDLGLLDYLEWLKASGETALFPKLTLKSARKLLFPSVGEWWSLYLREHGALPAGGGRQPSREFRHTWTSAARASGIARDAREFIQGHSAADGTANEGYGELHPLGLQIDRLEYPDLDLTGVQRWTAPQA